MSAEGPGDFCKPHGVRLPCDGCLRDHVQAAVLEGIREQTAATILAALVTPVNLGAALCDWHVDTSVTVKSLGAADKQLVAYSVALADALRVELSKERK